MRVCHPPPWESPKVEDVQLPRFDERANRMTTARRAPSQSWSRVGQHGIAFASAKPTSSSLTNKPKTSPPFERGEAEVATKRQL